jgi:Na+/proline symporter
MEKYGLFIVGLFLLINLIIGLWAGRNVKDVKDYAIGNKKWSVGALVMTYLATAFGGGFMFSDSKSFYNYGIGPLLAGFAISISHIFISFFLSNKLQILKGCISLGDAVEKFFGKKSKIFTGIISIPFNLSATALQIAGLSIVLKNFLYIPDNYNTVLISGLILSLYTALGGLEAVTATDILQFVLMICSFFILTAVAVSKAGGIYKIINEMPKEKFNFFQNEGFGLFFPLIIVNGIFSVITFQPPRFQRLLSTKNSLQTRKVFLFCSIGSAILYIFLAFLSWAALILYPNCKDDFLQKIFETYISSSLKPIIGLGFLAFIFSSGDSFLHSSSVSIANDLIRPFLLKKNKDINLITLKFICLIVGVLSTLMVYFNIKLFPYNITGFLIPIIGPLLLSILGKKIKKFTFWISSLVSLIFFIFFQYKILFSISMKYSMLICTIISYFSIYICEKYNKKIKNETL